MSGFVDRADVWVQPIVVSKHHCHTETVTAAASASVAVRDVPHTHPSFPSTNYDRWLAGPFTKTVRRASLRDLSRLLDWAEGEGVPHFAAATADGHGTAVAFAPMRYADMPKLISKLQVRGTDFERTNLDGSADPSGLGPMVLVDATLTTGKASAAAAHAAWAWMLEQERRGADLSAWRHAGCPVGLRLLSARGLAAGASESGAIPIVDRGLTEVEPDTLTAVAQSGDAPSTEAST